MAASAVAAPKRARSASRRAAANGSRARVQGSRNPASRGSASGRSRSVRGGAAGARQRSAEVIRFPVHAVGRTAGAVSELADSGVVVGMARGRAWIVIVGLLLGGIVAVNVLGLSLSASSSQTAAKIDALQRENSVLRGRTANRLSNDKVSAVAARLGLAVPAAGDVGYLEQKRKNAEQAARRIAAGEITVAPPYVPDPALAESQAVVPADPSSAEPAAPVETAATTTPAPEAVATGTSAPATSETAEPTATADSAAGGLQPGVGVP